MKRVAVLFARSDSIYHSMPECDVYDIERDARTWQGGMPGVFHPPCRGWGRMRQFAKVRKGERQLAVWAIRRVREHGGVIEHPAESRLWARCHLPRPGRMPDRHGGWSARVDQFVFGHRAEKATWLYIVGVGPDGIPEMPIRGGAPTHCIRPTKAYPRLPSITKREREATPPPFARWLVDLAMRCKARHV